MTREQENRGLDALLHEGKKGVECFVEEGFRHSLKMIKYRYEAITHKKLFYTANGTMLIKKETLTKKQK
jgi:hypothetical protein